MQSKYIRLGELFNVVAGGTPSRSNLEYYQNGKIPWVKISDMLQSRVKFTDESITLEAVKDKRLKILPKGTILISIFATVGRTAVLDIDATTNQAIVGLIPEKNITDNSYIRYFLDFICNDLKDKSRGVAQDNINKSILSDVLIPIPPLSEQKRIAEILDKADTIRQKRKESIALLDEFLRSVFLDMFGDPVRNEKGWEKKTFKSIVEDYDYGLSDKADEDIKGIPMLRMNNITYEGRIDTTNLKYINESKFKSKYLLMKNDFLFNRTNSPELVGKCSVWNSNEKYTFAGYLIRFRFNESLASSYYVSHYFNSSYGKKYIFSKARPSINMSNISASTLMGFSILIPPINLQNQFTKIVEQVEATKAKMEESLKEMDNQFNALLQGAFRS